MAFLSRTTTVRRSAPWIGATTGDPWGLALLALLYVKSYFAFNPFPQPGNEIDASGSTVNQLIWISILGFAGIIIWRNLGIARALLRRVWPALLPLAWFALTYLWTLDSSLTLRRVALIILVAAVAFGVAVARPSPSDFLKVSLLVLGAILFLSVLSVFAVPHLARPGGNFVGMYGHKNSAGAVAAVVFVFWFFAVFWARQVEFKIACLFGTLLWLFFLVGTFSKTSIGAAAVTSVFGIGAFYVLRLDSIWRATAYAATFVIACFTVWLILLFDLSLEQIGIFIFEDLTFTNRTYLWEFVWRSIEERYWFGHGYGAFWYVGEGVANRLDSEPGWAATATSAHNGYLNIWLEAGFVGLALCGLALFMAVRGAMLLLRRPDVPAADRWVYALVLAQIVLLMGRDMMEASLYRGHASSSLVFFLVYFLVELWRWESQRD